jgi:hypothetical protein
LQIPTLNKTYFLKLLLFFVFVLVIGCGDGVAAVHFDPLGIIIIIIIMKLV